MTNRRWLCPLFDRCAMVRAAFEKMLYDNALLARVYVEAYQVTQKPRIDRWLPRCSTMCAGK